MLQDLRIEKEDLQALLAEMEKRGFVATTLHEIRTFTMAQRRTPRVPDVAYCVCSTSIVKGGICVNCKRPYKSQRW